MDTTVNLALPMLAPGQSQKESYHNEALVIADFMICGAIVEDVVRNTPPASPVAGQCWIVGAAPTGAFVSHIGHVAGYTAGGWRFVAPVDGMAMTCPSSGVILTRRNAQWERGIARCLEMRVDDKRVVGPRQPAIAYPTGGTGADSVARASIGLIIDALRAHGLIDP